MRAVLLTGHGGYECLSVRDDLLVPVAGAEELLIRIAAAAVNNTDVDTRLGWYSGGGWTGSFQFPRIQGIDACGVVADIGAGVSPLLLGRRVLIEPCWRAPHEPLASARFFGSEVYGAFAQYAVVPERHVHPIESPLTDTELASFPCSYSTAENMLVRALGVTEVVDRDCTSSRHSALPHSTWSSMWSAGRRGHRCSAL